MYIYEPVEFDSVQTKGQSDKQHGRISGPQSTSRDLRVQSPTSEYNRRPQSTTLLGPKILKIFKIFKVFKVFKVF